MTTRVGLFVLTVKEHSMAKRNPNTIGLLLWNPGMQPISDRSNADKMGDIFVQYDLPSPERANNAGFLDCPTNWIRFCAQRHAVGYRTAQWSAPPDGRGILCWMSACMHSEFRLPLQKNSKSQSVRNQQQRHYQSRNEICGPQLPRQ